MSESRPAVERLPDAGECLETPKKLPIGGRRAAVLPREPWRDDERVFVGNLGTYLGFGGSENGGGQYARRSPTFKRRKRVRG